MSIFSTGGMSFSTVYKDQRLKADMVTPEYFISYLNVFL